MTEETRIDGRCQRCEGACFSFAVEGVGLWRRWLGAYIGGAPPKRDRMTCLACLTPEELARVERMNPEHAIAPLLSRLEAARSAA